jgi:hypothetical protein
MPHILNGRPTQEPLNREQQAQAFEALKRNYGQQDAPHAPKFPVEPVKETKLSENEQLKTLQQLMKERGMPETAVAKVEEKVQENHTKETIKQFYCRHEFQRVQASFLGMPVRTKICSKCGLVK